MTFFLEYVLFCLQVLVSKTSCKYKDDFCFLCIVMSPRRSTDRYQVQLLVTVLHPFLQLYFLIFRILNFCKVDFVDCNTVCVHCLCETIYNCIISVYTLNAFAFNAVFRNSNKC